RADSWRGTCLQRPRWADRLPRLTKVTSSSSTSPSRSLPPRSMTPPSSSVSQSGKRRQRVIQPVFLPSTRRSFPRPLRERSPVLAKSSSSHSVRYLDEARPAPVCLSGEYAKMSAPDISLENIERAARVIDPVFRDSPQFVDEQLCAALGRRIVVKVETLNPIRSFKGRGADFFVQDLQDARKLVCASAGNFGQAMAYVGRHRGIDVEVFVAADANPIKVDRMRAFNATVTVGGPDFDSAKQAARQYADRNPGCVFVEDG